MDFPYRLLEDAPEGAVLLLPSPFATLVRGDGGVRLVGPHGGVQRLGGIETVMSCSPNVVKALAGHPRLFVGRIVSAAEAPLLHVFAEHPAAQWPLLLADLRDAVDETDDERRFARVWRSLADGARPAGPEAQRQQERLCRRYAGQAPSLVRRQLRLAAQLAADLAAGRHRALGAFTDQSHYVRECRALTGATPGRWLRTPGAVLAADGAPVPRAAHERLSRAPLSAPSRYPGRTSSEPG